MKRILKDNQGWGLAEMIVLSCIIIIALLIATYFIYVLYQSF